MAELFDFSKFYKKKEVLTDAVIDMSGLALKSDALSYTQNEDGTLNESNTNISPTPNVKYYITGIKASIDKYPFVKEYPHSKPLEINDDLTIMVGDPLSDLVKAGIYRMPQTPERITDIKMYAKTDDESNSDLGMYIARTSISDGSVDELYFGDESSGLGITASNHRAITLYVTPRVEFMCGTPEGEGDENSVPKDSKFGVMSSYVTGERQNVTALMDPDAMSRAMGLLGFRGDRDVTSTWLTEDIDRHGKMRAVMDEDMFKARIERISERCQGNGYGISVKYYDQSYMQTVVSADGTEETKVDITSTNIGGKWSYNDLYSTDSAAEISSLFIKSGKVSQSGKTMGDFVSYVNSDDMETFAGETLIDTLTDPIPVIPNIRDAFGAYYYSREELRNAFFRYTRAMLPTGVIIRKFDDDKHDRILEYIENGEGLNVYRELKELEDGDPPIGTPALMPSYYLFVSHHKDWYAAVDHILVYEHVTGCSVFRDRSLLTEDTTGMDPVGNGFTDQWKFYTSRPARLMVPVSMTKPVRVSYKVFGRTRHRTERHSIGVRWAEVTFLDTTVHTEYPKVNDTPKRTLLIDRDATFNRDDDTGMFTLGFDNALEGGESNLVTGDIVGRDDVAVTILQGTFEYKRNTLNYVGEMEMGGELTASLDGIEDGSTVHVSYAYTDLQKTKKDNKRSNVTIRYEMPHLPYDDEVRRNALIEFGPFDQAAGAQITRRGTSYVDTMNTVDGWKIFYDSSRKLSEMRSGLGLHDKVSMLLAILKNEFGESRVELCETRRSADDQSMLCAGGASSSFLSWHNYGLAAKIMIYREDDHLTAIEDGSADMRRLIDIAEAFTKCCREGKFGTPVNVVWCGRLVIGANIFDWEFLPIGFGHKDAPKYRDLLFNQEDPVASLGYIDAESSGYLHAGNWQGSGPRILATSSSYISAEVINGHHFVNPDGVRDYEPPSNITLLNVFEFTNLIRTKMAANGSELGDTGSMYEWKIANPNSYRQLVTYFGLTGNMSAAKALIAGEYVEMYQDIFDMYYTEDPVTLVKSVLGDEYENVRIYIENSSDAGYISLANGHMYVKVRDTVPDIPFDQSNVFNQKQVDLQHLKYGRWDHGVFYDESERDFGYIESDEPCIDGYDAEGNPVRGTAYLLHSMLSAQMLEEFNNVKNSFENYNGQLLFDRYELGPNAGDYHLLENEFGVIAAQDLMSFDKLRSVYLKRDINAKAKHSSDGTVLGDGANEEDKGAIGSEDPILYPGSASGTDGSMDGSGTTSSLGRLAPGRSAVRESIFEKMVSNAQLSGLREASLTKEHIKIVPRLNKKVSVETLYKMIYKDRPIDANDLLI